MQCTATLDTGARCPLDAAPNTPTCSDHTPAPPPPSPLAFYSRKLRPRDRKTLEAAANLKEMDAEVCVLRALIADALERRDHDTAVRRIMDLNRVLSSRKPRRDDEKLTAWLNQALDELDAETDDPNVARYARTGS